MKSKEQKKRHFDEIAAKRDLWKAKSSYYYRDLENFLAFVIPREKRVLEVGCGTGDLLQRLDPERGLGVDFSEGMVREAERKYPKDSFPNLEFRVDDAEELSVDETFDYVVMSDLIGELNEIWAAFRSLRAVTRSDSRVIITYFNALWEPALRTAEKLGLKMPQDYQNWLSLDDIQNLMELNGFEITKKGYRFLFPKYIPLLSPFLNKVVAKLPLIRKLCLVVYLVARRKDEDPLPGKAPSVTVLVPCRNELGNIRPAIERIPSMGSHTEILFVDGNSNDGTVEEIETVIEEYGDRKHIKLLHQVPPGSEDGAGHGKMLKLGKGDAVRKGFAAASGDILMILDADLTVPPEDLPKFYLALVEGHGELINGTRLVYPMEKEAMRTFNKMGNKFFSLLFTWLLDQRIKDTLCGTKVLFKKDYEKIAAGREYFGDFDPFGDFDLLFGAAKQNLKIVEVPIRYRERTYGEIKIQRFRHGILLLKMSFIAMVKLKLK